MVYLGDLTWKIISDTYPGILVSLGCHNEIPQTGSLNNRNVFSYSSDGWKSKIKVRRVDF